MGLVVSPTFAEFERLARAFDRVAVSVEIPADLETPVGVFMRLDEGRPTFLLESVTGGDRWGRYSFIGIDPERILSYRVSDGDPLEKLRKELGAAKASPALLGGAVGFVAHDAVRTWERVRTRTVPSPDAPTAAFMIPRTVVAFDNVTHRSVVTSFADTRGDTVRAAYDAAVARVEEVLSRLRRPLIGRPAVRGRVAVKRATTRSEFVARVDRAKEYIAAGDAIQIVLSQRFAIDAADVDLFRVYRALRMTNPSPYLFFVRLPDLTLVGASPEILVKVTRVGAAPYSVEVRPIAGTRPRGASDDEDCRLAKELLADPKERAEHLMLVDLGRNDVGRVARVGTVSVPEFMTVERYSHVMHIVSHVRGELASGCDAFDAARAAFPAGTLTGAPKVRAMEIIDELEGGVGRGLYGGAVGLFGWDGSANLAITIRSLVAPAAGNWYVQAGAGIVADSEPERECDECENKAKAVIAALEAAAEETWW